MKALFLTVCISFLCLSNTFAQEKQTNGFLFDKFEKGIVVYRNGSRAAAPLNYNMLNGEMLFLQADSTVLAIANPTSVLLVTISNRRFSPDSNGVFYEEIQIGNGFLYILHKATMITKGKASGYGAHSQTSAINSIQTIHTSTGSFLKLNLDETYDAQIDHSYYLKQGKNYKKFYSAKTLGKLIKGRESEIEKFGNEQAIDFSKQEDVTRIVEYAFSLESK